MAGASTDPVVLSPVRIEARATPALEQAHDNRTRSALRAVHALYELGKRLFTDAPGLKTHGRLRSDKTLYEDAIRSVLECEPDVRHLRATLKFQSEEQGSMSKAHNELVDAVEWLQGLLPTESSTSIGTPLEHAAAKVAQDSVQVGSHELESLLSDIQGNVLSGYDGVNVGALLCFQCTSADGLRKLLEKARAHITTEQTARSQSPEGVYSNLGITYAGLKLLELPESTLQEFSREFREGMEERAGQLGDVAHNHPEFWRLPLDRTSKQRVHLSTIHVAMTLLGQDKRFASALSQWEITDEHWRIVHALPLSTRGQPEGSQPVPQAPYAATPSDRASPLDILPLGEFFLGHSNRRGRVAACADPERNRSSHRLFQNGTFLALRKMRYDEERFEKYLEGAVEEVGKPSGKTRAPESALKDELRAKILGTKSDGRVLGKLQPGPGQPANAFDYSQDEKGELCPLRSHTRRANPRTDPCVEATPRIVRRSLRYDRELRGREEGESGLLFMAYCASLAEQYEIVQRYVNGSNSTGLSTRHNDLLCGVPSAGLPYVISLAGTSTPARGEPEVRLPDVGEPFVTLRWGLYLFVPSLSGIEWLTADRSDTDGERRQSAAIARGQARLRELEAMPVGLRIHEWKRLLEEVPEAGSSQARHAEDIAAAITHAGGALCVQGDRTRASNATAFVVVTTVELAQQVLSRDNDFSVREYGERLRAALDDHYLGHDVIGSRSGLSYAERSTQANGILESLGSHAFDDAYREAKNILNDPSELELDPDRTGHDGSRRSTISVRDLASAVVAKLCHTWLDMPGVEGRTDVRSLMNSLERFLVASRFCFQAMPVEYLAQRARENRRTILDDYERVTYLGLFRDLKPPESANRADTTQASAKKRRRFAAFTEKFKLADYVVRRVVFRGKGAVVQSGVVDDFRRMASLGAVGFAPPAVGAITRVLDQWIETDQLWQLQRTVGADRSALLRAICEALGKTPAPPTLYRTSTRWQYLGNRVRVPAGARVVVNLAAVYADAKRKNHEQPEAWFFGGRHGGIVRAEGHTPHGCPARDAGLLVMAGIITALLDRKSLKRERRFLLSYDTTP